MKNTAKKIGKKLDINKIKSNCLPENKIEFISNYQKNNAKVLMIGDEINDAPSLKKADVGVAMGNIGSDITIEASDITLVNDNIKYIPYLITISKKTLKTINNNIIFSLSLNFFAMFLAIVGILEPVTGALVHNLGSVLVIFYSSMLLKFKYIEN